MQPMVIFKPMVEYAGHNTMACVCFCCPSGKPDASLKLPLPEMMLYIDWSAMPGILSKKSATGM